MPSCFYAINPDEKGCLCSTNPLLINESTFITSISALVSFRLLLLFSIVIFVCSVSQSYSL